MGERGARNEAATAEDIAAMRAIVLDAIRAGALGFSTSRTLGHRAIDGELVPGTFASEDELFGLGSALGEAGAGVFELAPLGSAGEMLEDAWQEVDWMRRLSAAIDRPVSYVLLQADDDPELWRKQLAASLEACAEGAKLFPQIAGRPTGILSGHHTTLCLFSDFPAYAALRERCSSPAELAAALADPAGAAVDCVVDARRRRPRPSAMTKAYERTFILGNPPDYEPGPERSLAGVAAASGRTPLEVAYDEMARDGGQGLLYIPILNYATGDLDHVREMMLHPQGLLGLADGGAHTGTICDASMPTFMLTHWTRDRSRGERLPLEYVVQKQTRDTARLYGMADRGTVEPGALADLNLIDYDALTLGAPYRHQRPAGGRSPAAPEGVGLRGDPEGRHRDVRARGADRRPAGPPGARRPLIPAGPAPPTSAPSGSAARQTAPRMEAPLTQYALRDGIHIGYQVWGQAPAASGGRAGATCSSSTAGS